MYFPESDDQHDTLTAMDRLAEQARHEAEAEALFSDCTEAVVTDEGTYYITTEPQAEPTLEETLCAFRESISEALRGYINDMNRLVENLTSLCN